MATSVKKKAKVEAPRRGRPRLPKGEARSGRISMRTYPDIAAKVQRNGTEWLENLIRCAKDAED